MTRIVGAISAVMLMVAVTAAPVEARSRGGKAALWTAVGAAAGFGCGLLVGLAAFDDAIDSERKVWTTALASAAAGGAIGYVVSRAGRGRGASPSRLPLPLSDRDVGALARMVRLREHASSVVQSADADASARQF